ncbi:hypothetical protein F8A90_07170 [Cobetia sp. cqz5-12]|uniref:YfbU family protein n=1 Tax=Cobetia sp. cqz5-12 TaxID=2609415 RepID=UPI0019051CE8|nr:YfbU family protein [Cobetia sp. cqz5-12]QQK63931.1 hypothetical protein F8A90_07170 [Cobetia sp. cqz5-12]
MNITDGEKIILLMLTEIYEKLDIEGRDIEPEFIRSAIFSDHTWSIPWRYTGITFENNETPQAVSEVIEILDMWSIIERNYNALSDDQKEQITREEDLTPDIFKFEGFDGNNESEYMSAASFIVNKLNRFDEFRGRDFNSHCPKIESYKRILNNYNLFYRDFHHGIIPRHQLIEIMRAARHEENG